jgi:large subunit ribosomal protein L25
MATASLAATIRTENGKGAARTLRRSGHVPGVIYGHSRQPQSLALNSRDLERLLERISTASTVIELSMGATVAKTLIREIQRDPIKRTVLHIDFQELVAGEKVSVKCPIVYVGTPEGVRLGGGLLDQIMHDLMVEADPSNIPHHIDVDVSTLGVGKSLHVSDLSVPAGVRILEDADATVCIVQASKTHDDAPAADGSAEPEVIRKAKTEDAEK